MSSNICRVCTNTIVTMCRRGTGLCGNSCEKVFEEEPRVISGLEVRDTSLHVHGLGKIEIVDDSSVERPSVPSLLGWIAAEKLEKHTALMLGDIRHNQDQTYDYWNGKTWSQCEKPVRKAS